MAGSLTQQQEERFRHLLMLAVDDALSAAEHEEFDAIIASHPACEQEWQEFRQLKHVTHHLSFRQPEKEVWEMYWVNVYNRIERGVAWVLLSIGILILASYGGYQFILEVLRDYSMPLVVKIGLLATVTGFAALLISVIREKVFLGKRDPYKEVQK